jgi:hypothetical protein
MSVQNLKQRARSKTPVRRANNQGQGVAALEQWLKEKAELDPVCAEAVLAACAEANIVTADELQLFCNNTSPKQALLLESLPLQAVTNIKKAFRQEDVSGGSGYVSKLAMVLFLAVALAGSYYQGHQTVAAKTAPAAAASERNMHYIGEMLVEHGLSKYCETFAKEQVDWETLLVLDAADMKELGVTIGDRKRLQALIASLATKEVQQEEKDVVKQKAVVKIKQEAEANAKQEAEEKARGVEGEEAAKLEADEKAGVEAEEAARLKPEVEADEKERAIGGRMKKSVAQEEEAYERRRVYVERLPANERDRLERLPAGEREREEERLIEAEAEEKAKQEAEEKAKAEAEEKAKQEAEEKAKAEAEEKAKQGAEEKAKAEAEEKAKQAFLSRKAEKAKKEAEAKANAEAKNQSHLLVYLVYLPSIYHLLLVLHELGKESEENAKELREPPNIFGLRKFITLLGKDHSLQVKAVYLFSSFCFDISLLGMIPCGVRLALPFVSPEQTSTVSFAVCVVIYFTNQFHLPIDDTKALIEAAVESSDRVSTTRVIFVHWSNFGYQVLFSSIAPKPKTMPKAKTMIGAVFAEGKKIYKAGIKKMQSAFLQMLLSMHPVKMAYITCIPAQTPLGFSACTYVTPSFTSITLIATPVVGGGDCLWFGLSIMAFSRYAVEFRPCSMQEDKAQRVRARKKEEDAQRVRARKKEEDAQRVRARKKEEDAQRVRAAKLELEHSHRMAILKKDAEMAVVQQQVLHVPPVTDKSSCGTFVDVPKVRACVCTAEEARAEAERLEQERHRAMAQAKQARRIKIEGGDTRLLRTRVNGVYKLEEGNEVNGRGVWKCAGYVSTVFMYYASSNEWWISDRVTMEAGRAAGFMSAASTALTPDKITETWQVVQSSHSGKGWVDAPKMRARLA